MFFRKKQTTTQQAENPELLVCKKTLEETRAKLKIAEKQRDCKHHIGFRGVRIDGKGDDEVWVEYCTNCEYEIRKVHTLKCKKAEIFEGWARQAEKLMKKYMDMANEVKGGEK